MHSFHKCNSPQTLHNWMLLIMFFFPRMSFEHFFKNAIWACFDKLCYHLALVDDIVVGPRQRPFCSRFIWYQQRCLFLQVDILCGGKPVSPGMTLHDLAGCWLNKGQKGRVRSSVGTPADGFIAKVFYGRSGSSTPETENNQGWSRAFSSFLKQRRVISFIGALDCSEHLSMFIDVSVTA